MDKAIQALRVAEVTLREIITQTLSAKAYRDLAKVAGVADKVTALVSELNGDAPLLTSESTPSIQESQNQRHRPVRASNATSRRGGYPRFLRDGDRLVKVSWSKKERQPYEHRAPRAIIKILIDTALKRKGEGKLFEATDVLPLMAENGEEYPSYQSYLALAWLRQVGIVVKKGRVGYVIKPGAATAEQVGRFWAALPTED
ncbi:MAG TPA: hypothetical protein VMT94_02275 [Burkholderiales bacterium]|nr:hypothetical protein [Burkholderiales bacterium]